MEQEKKKLNLKIIIPIVVVVIVAIVGIIVSNNSNETGKSIFNSKTYYHIGDTVSTDIAEFTLNNSALTIALERGDNENYYTPKEYNAEEDRGNPYLADTGNTLAYFDFTLSAIDRSDIEIYVKNIGYARSCFVSVEHNGKKYSDKEELTIGREKKINTNGTLISNGGKNYIDYTTGEWQSFTSNKILLLSGEQSQYKGYLQIAVNVENLKDKYYITFKLPNSQGKTEDFTYVINE